MSSLSRSRKDADTAAADNFTTGNIEVASGDNLLLVKSFIGDGDPRGLDEVRWGGSGGTLMSRVPNTTVQEVATYGRYEWFYLVSPAVQTAGVYLKWPVGQGEKLIIVEVYQIDNAADPFETANEAVGTGDTPSVAATSVSGELVTDGVSVLNTSGIASLSLAEGAGQTSIQEITGDVPGGTFYEGHGSSYETAAGASTTMSWTFSPGGSGGEGRAIKAVAFKAAAAGPPFPPVPEGVNQRRSLHPQINM